MHCGNRSVLYFARRLLMFVIAALACSVAGDAQIIIGPSNQAIPLGGTAVFNCSLACTSSPTPVTWYMTFPSNGRTLAVSQYTQVKLINDVDVSRASIDGCSQGGYRVEQLIITRPSAALNLMPVQCSTLCFEGDCACSTVQVFFSKFAVLQINVPPLATSAGVSPITPSSVAPCLPPQDIVTTANMYTEVKFITVTQTATAPLPTPVV